MSVRRHPRWQRRLLAGACGLVLVGGTLAVAGLARTASAGTVGTAAIPAPPAGFSLTWSDDFTGAGGTGLDTGGWKYDTGPGSSFGTGEIETMTNSTANVYQDGAGHLVLKALHSGSDPNAGWTSGRVETQAATFGAPPGGVVMMQASIQQPNVTTANGAGYWPAFWMLGSTLRTGTPWPASGEVDILEDINGRSSVFGTLHCGTNPGGPCNESSGIGSGERPCPGCQTAFHTYAVQIDRSVSPEQIRWYLDGANYFTLSADRVDATTWANAVDHPFFIIFDLAMGGGFPAAFGGGPTASTVSGGQMTVDYVAVYNKPPGGGGSNLAQGRPTSASSTESAAYPAANATDGNSGTRWSSAFSDPQWLQVDLGATHQISRVVLNWEAAYGKAFQLQTSGDGATWTTVYSTTTGTGGTQDLAVSGSGRYVRLYGTARATGYGYSLWEFQVYAASGSGSSPVISQFQPVKASSYVGGNAPAAALDGRTTTRWESAASDPQWISVDLGGTATITGVVLTWEAAYATGYRIDVSADGAAWTTVYSTTTGKGGVENLAVSGSGRYVRLYGTVRATGYGYSLWEFEVHGTVDTSSATPSMLSGPTGPPATTGQFALSAPADGAMVTGTRRPALSWAPVPGAVRYQVWINISRTDYDFTAAGNLIDLYTKVAEPTGTGYTPTWDLPDRWTYKWYVVAVNGSGATTTSAIRTFSVYLPGVSTAADGVAVLGGARDLNKDGVIEPYEDWRQPIDTRVGDLLGRMTVQEKAYQMFYNAQTYPQAGWHFGPAQPQDLNGYLLAASGTRLGIPFISAGDTIHGYQTTYPTQSALAAGKDYALDYKLGDMQRKEELEVGTRGVLGPLAEVGTKVLYPRIQEGNGENADVAAAGVRALVAGLQGGPELNPRSVLATVKHWPGEGAGGEAGITYDAVTIKYHMIPFRAAMEAGAVNIMPGYAGSLYLDPGGPGAGDSAKILAYLRQNLGYTGLITTDWLPSGQPWIDAANAGSDVMGGADPGAAGFSLATFIANVPAGRIDDAVRRVLRLKFALGLFENPYGDPVNGPYRWHQPSYTALANQAERESLTLLKNNGVLPLKLKAGDNIVVAGPRATDPNSCCIWTSYFHSEDGSLDLLDAITARASTAGVNVYSGTGPSPKLAVVAVGEASYTHATNWTKEQPYLPPDQLSIIQNFKSQGIPVVVLLVLPRPYVISEWNGLADAIVVTYRGGEEMGPAAAGLLFGDYTPRGRLPWQLPRSLDQVLRPGGTDVLSDAVENWDLPYDLGATDAERADIRAHIDAGQPVPTTYGNPLYPYGAGLQGWS